MSRVDCLSFFGGIALKNEGGTGKKKSPGFLFMFFYDMA
jgi:hypothetical protein